MHTLSRTVLLSFVIILLLAGCHPEQRAALQDWRIEQQRVKSLTRAYPRWSAALSDWEDAFQGRMDSALGIDPYQARIEVLRSLVQEAQSGWPAQLDQVGRELPDLQGTSEGWMKKPEGLSFAQYDGLKRSASDLRLIERLLNEKDVATHEEGKATTRQLSQLLGHVEEELAQLPPSPATE